MKILAFDVGGTKIAQAIVDENGKISGNVEIYPTPKTATEIENLFRKIIAENKFDGFALATAGVVFQNKLLGKPNNLPNGYQNIDFAKLLKVPFVIENDANAALWAEFKIGSLKGVQHGIMLTLGTDVGCGIVADGKILRGKTGATGEVSFPFSGRDLQRICAKHQVSETDCFKIFEAVLKGQQNARTAYYEWEENLISGLQLLNGLLDTEIFVLSGSLSKIVDYAKVSTSLSLLQPQNPAIVKPAVCGTDAGLIGAALMLKDKYFT